ncbi:hypothetical protein NPIL_444531, partial [Nephila pilipes]
TADLKRSNAEDRNDCTDLRKSEDECSEKKEIVGKKRRSKICKKVVSTVDHNRSWPYSSKLDDETKMHSLHRIMDDNVLRKPINCSKDSNLKFHASENKKLEVLDQKEVTLQIYANVLFAINASLVIVVSKDNNVFISGRMPTSLNPVRKHLLVKVI